MPVKPGDDTVGSTLDLAAALSNRHPSDPGQEALRQRSRAMVNRDGVVHIDRLTHNAALPGIFHGSLDERRNAGEAKLTADECVHCDLVCGIEYRRRSILRHKRLARQDERRKPHRVGRLEGQVCHLLEIEAAAPGIRSGQARQLAIGTRMSGGPSWAIIEPSRYSTI